MSPAAALGSAARIFWPGRPRSARTALRVVPRPASRPRRAPFVVLVLLLLGIGLIGLLVLNTALQQGSFELADLEQNTAVLRDRQAELTAEVANQSAPAVLARRAKALGMVPGVDLVFLHLDSAGSR